MGANLHVSMTNVKNASRLFKQTRSLLKYGLFDKIYVVGLEEKGLLENETLSEGQELWRINLKSRKLGTNVFAQGLKYIEYVWQILFKYRKKNIEVVTNHGLDTLLLGVLMKYIYGIKLVYDAHELETEKNGLVGIRKKLSKLTERLLIPFVDEIFVVSESIVEDYKARYNISKVHLVMNCPNKIESKKSDYFRKKYNIDSNALIYLYQGGLFPNRGIELMLSTFENFDSKQRVIVFMGYGALKDKIENYSQKSNSIFYHEAVPANVVLNYTASADVGISVLVFKEETNLSYYYCLPNKFFEYLMVGLPIICSDIPEMRKILSLENVGDLVKNNSIDSFNESIQRIEQLNFSKIKEKGQNILNIYNWEEQEKVLISVYEKVLNEN